MKSLTTPAPILALAVALPMSLVTVGGIAHASGVNYAHAWETSFGARWNGYVQNQGSHDDNGRHAKSGYHRFTREAGPQLDTGHIYTNTSTGASDTQVHSREDSVWDSPLCN